MELTYVTIVVLASMIFLLSGMVGYLYWQQNRLLQNVQSIAVVLSTQYSDPPQEHEPESEQEAETVPVTEDDRVPVEEEKVEHVEGPPSTPTATSAAEDDVDDLSDKTVSQLRDLLTQKGIPHGKRDAKPVLIQLLKATA